MTINQGNQADDLESRLKEVGEENELLLSQLHHVQEKLEQYYLRNHALEQERPARSDAGPALRGGWIDDELLEALAENRRLRSTVEVQQKVYLLETQNTLNAQLGDLLIQCVDSPGALLALPGKLGRIWRTHSRNTPPASLGGKGFGKVVAAYAESGFDGVEKLLVGVATSPAMRASGYTALARHLMNSDLRNATEAARRAYALDPKPYRLKWLAFRLHESGDVVEAEAILDILPPDTKFSDSETRQAGQLRDEAHNARLNEAKEATRCSERRAEIEQQLNRMVQDRDAQSQRLAASEQEVEALKKANARAEQERLSLVRRYENAVKQVVQCSEEMDALRLAKAQVEQEKLALAARYDEVAKQVAADGRELEGLKRAKAQLEHEKTTLAARHDETVKQEATRAQEVEVLKQAKAQLEQEKLAIAGRYDNAAKLAASRLTRINALQQQIQSREAEEAELATRQQVMQEEMVRAEAQLDLIKEMVFRESRP